MWILAKKGNRMNLINWSRDKIKKITLLEYSLVKTYCLLLGIIIGAYISTFVQQYITYFVIVVVLMILILIYRVFFKK